MTTGMTADEYTAKFEAGRKDWLQQGSFGGHIHPRPPTVDPFQGLLANITTIRLGKLEDCHTQPGPPPSRIYQAEAVNPSDPNPDLSSADSPNTDPHSHPHSRHLGTYGHQPELTQA